MKWLCSALLATALTTGTMLADEHKEKTKVEGTDPVTGEKYKSKSKIKSDDDGNYKEKSETKVGKTKTKREVKADENGNYKEKVKVDK